MSAATVAFFAGMAFGVPLALWIWKGIQRARQVVRDAFPPPPVLRIEIEYIRLDPEDIDWDAALREVQ
ncbi:MAG: hypothetical protein NVSMB32_09160 [Actinomycetota bacterium]